VNGATPDRQGAALVRAGSAFSFSDLELDALREMMNIGFGQAAAGLSEILDRKVKLSVPRIEVMRAERFFDFIAGQIGSPIGFSLVEQGFYGRFDGTAFLVVPDSEALLLARLVKGRASGTGISGEAVRDLLLEMGRIVICACIGKIAAQLEDRASFLAPSFLGSPVDAGGILRRLGSADRAALVFSTLFGVEDTDMKGFMVFVASERALVFAREAAAALIRSLE